MHTYDPRTYQHGLKHDPVKALVAPRPIGWVSTLSAGGVANLAPYSFFNLVNSAPVQFMFASSGHKDTLDNVEATREMVFNAVDETLIDQMNVTSTDHSGDEFELAGLEKIASTQVKPPRVKGALWQMEAVLDRVVELPCDIPNRRHAMVIATIVQVHLDDDLLEDGIVNVAKLNAVARCGYKDYVRVADYFQLHRPG